MPLSLRGRREQGRLHVTPASCRPIDTTVSPNHLDGKLIRRLEDKHTRVEWPRFLERIDGLTIHVVADDYATHKHAKVRAWLARRPRFEMRFTPTSGSWLNLVERFFADLTAAIRAGGFASVAARDRAPLGGAQRRSAGPPLDRQGRRRLGEDQARPGAAGGGLEAQLLIQPISSAGH